MIPGASLSCEGIERYLGEDESRVHALRGVSLDVTPGSTHAVVGPSGCGKSTLLYILGLLDRPDAGSVMLGSEPAFHLSDQELSRRRNEFIGFIFQFHFLMEDFSAHENVMIPMRKLGRLSAERQGERAAGDDAAPWEEGEHDEGESVGGDPQQGPGDHRCDEGKGGHDAKRELRGGDEKREQDRG